MRRLWSELSDDDIDGSKTERDRLARLLQERCGYSRERADEEVKQLFDRPFDLEK